MIKLQVGIPMKSSWKHKKRFWNLVYQIFLYRVPNCFFPGRLCPILGIYQGTSRFRWKSRLNLTWIWPRCDWVMRMRFMKGKNTLGVSAVLRLPSNPDDLPLSFTSSSRATCCSWSCARRGSSLCCIHACLDCID